MTTTAPASTVRFPTADEAETYRTQGFVVARGLVPASVLDAADQGMARFYAGDHDRPFPGRTRYGHQDWTPEHGDGLRKNDYASRMVDELAALAEWPGIGAFAAGLAGADGIRLWHDQLLFKPPTPGSPKGNVGWHTDRQYWTSCSSAEMLTCWVPFHDCDAAMGGVSFVPGSHRWETGDELSFFDPDLDRQAAHLAGAHGSVEPVVPDLRRGDVTFHHCRTVHGSRANLTDQPRRSMAIHLQPADNTWVSAVDATGTPIYHCNDDLVRSVDGHPDYADPAICPVLWQTGDR